MTVTDSFVEELNTNALIFKGKGKEYYDLSGSVYILYNNLVNEKAHIPVLSGIYLWLVHRYGKSMPEEYSLYLEDTPEGHKKKNNWSVISDCVAPSDNTLHCYTIRDIINYSKLRGIKPEILKDNKEVVVSINLNKEKYIFVVPIDGFEEAKEFYMAFDSLSKKDISKFSIYVYYKT